MCGLPPICRCRPDRSGSNLNGNWRGQSRRLLAGKFCSCSTRSRRSVAGAKSSSGYGSLNVVVEEPSSRSCLVHRHCWSREGLPKVCRAGSFCTGARTGPGRNADWPFDGASSNGSTSAGILARLLSPRMKLHGNDTWRIRWSRPCSRAMCCNFRPSPSRRCFVICSVWPRSTRRSICHTTRCSASFRMPATRRRWPVTSSCWRERFWCRAWSCFREARSASAAAARNWFSGTTL